MSGAGRYANPAVSVAAASSIQAPWSAAASGVVLASQHERAGVTIAMVVMLLTTLQSPSIGWADRPQLRNQETA